MTRATKTCPSPTPTFDARDLKTAKWTSAEEVWNQDKTSLRSLPQTWTPRNQPSPSPTSVKPVSFDSNSLKRNQQTKSVTSTNSGNSTPAVQPEESFAWKDSTLERKLKDLKSKQFSDAEITKPKDNGVDKHLGKSLQSWSTALPKPPDADVTLLKKAREEKKVKRYLEDNFQNRDGRAYISEPEIGNDSDIGGLTSKYSTLDRRIDRPDSVFPDKTGYSGRKINPLSLSLLLPYKTMEDSFEEKDDDLEPHFFTSKHGVPTRYFKQENDKNPEVKRKVYFWGDKFRKFLKLLSPKENWDEKNAVKKVFTAFLIHVLDKLRAMSY